MLWPRTSRRVEHKNTRPNLQGVRIAKQSFRSRGNCRSLAADFPNHRRVYRPVSMSPLSVRQCRRETMHHVEEVGRLIGCQCESIHPACPGDHHQSSRPGTLDRSVAITNLAAIPTSPVDDCPGRGGKLNHSSQGDLHRRGA